MIARRRLLGQLLSLSVALPPMLAGCGWEPLYANPQTGKASADLRAIRVLPIPERVGQMLETGLRESLNPDHLETKPVYTLSVTLGVNLRSLGIQSQGLGTRGEVQLTASYRLVETATNKVLQVGAVGATDSFDIQANGYSTVVAQDDAKLRAVEQARRELVARLTMFMQNRGSAPS